MVRRIDSLRVFVASPSDVGDERLLLEQVISELNKLEGERLGLRLDLVKWETDTYPSIGNDAQTVINDQIGDDYDIFIGILWKRFGTPTDRGDSGTDEEFTRAYKRALENPTKIQIMVYFNESPVSFSELEDIEQYKMVISFRKRIGKQGVYYWSYKKTDDFSTLVRLHLGRVMQNFGTKWGQKPEMEVKVKVNAEQKERLAVETEANDELIETLSDETRTVLNDEEGFLDLIISSGEDLALGTESIKRIGALLKELNEKTTNHTEEINQLSKPINPNEARIIINRQADTWENFATRAEAELPILSAKFRSGINSYAKSAQIMTDFQLQLKDRVTVQGALDAIKTLKVNVIEAIKKTMDLKKAVLNIPRMTVRLNHAKRYLVTVLDEIIDEYEVEENLSTEAEKIIVDVLQKINLT